MMDPTQRQEGNTDPFQLLDTYLLSLADKVAPKTLRSYRSDIHGYLRWRMTAPVMRGIEWYLQEQPSLSLATVTYRRARLFQFARYARLEDAWIPGPGLPAPVRRPAVRQVCDQEKLGSLLARISDQHARDYLVYGLIYYACLHVGEVVYLRQSDVSLLADLHTVELRIHSPNPAMVSRKVTLSQPVLTERLLSWTGALREDTWLFTGSRTLPPGPLKQQNVHQRWTGYCHQAEMKCSLAGLRRSGIENWLDSGMSRHQVADQLGYMDTQAIKKMTAPVK